MPFYKYKCSHCDTTQTIFHLINDDTPACTNCEQFDTMVKLVTTPFIKTESKDKNSTTGEITKEYIEANKELLKEEKEKAKRETYEPS